jgi:prevent-host-death family protein
VERIAISTFKATCLDVLKRVKRTGRPVLVTKRGEPVAQVTPPPAPRRRKSGYGCLAGTAQEIGDIVAPLPAEDWEALR